MDASDQSLGFATPSIICANLVGPTVARTPLRFVTSGANLDDHAADSCGRSTYPVLADVDVPSTPTPSAPAVEDCSIDRSASGDALAAAAAGEGADGFAAAAPAAAYDPAAFAAANPLAMALAYVGGLLGALFTATGVSFATDTAGAGTGTGVDTSDDPIGAPIGAEEMGPAPMGARDPPMGATPPPIGPDRLGAPIGASNPPPTEPNPPPNPDPFPRLSPPEPRPLPRPPPPVPVSATGRFGNGLASSLSCTCDAGELRQHRDLPGEGLRQPRREPRGVAPAEPSQRQVLLLRSLLRVVRVRAREHVRERLRHSKRLGAVHAEQHAAVLRHPAEVKEGRRSTDGRRQSGQRDARGRFGAARARDRGAI